MRTRRKLLMTLAAIGCLPGMAAPSTVTAEEHGRRREVISLVFGVRDAIRAHGLEAVVTEINHPEDRRFHIRDLYPVIFDKAGVVLAHGALPQLIGVDNMPIRDPDGLPIVKIIMQISRREQSGWVRYRWLHPGTGEVRDKHSFILRDDELTIMVGYYP